MQEQNTHGFIEKITEIIENNISNEQFGVSELANEIGMSRSNLLRKVQKLTKLSVSQFIRQIKLKNAMEMLSEGSYNVSEVSFKVGFSSTSYFIKCFREHYGYPPGEVGKNGNGTFSEEQIVNSKKNKKLIWASVLIAIIIPVLSIIIYNTVNKSTKELEKSIAVLPFKNDSSDSTNVYIVNGLMESILNNLQKIEGLRVISRTSSEKYRDSKKSIPEIANELKVSYIIEGSGQKMGDQILLNIQLIEAKRDNHLWAEQYNRESKDIFQLQMDVAKSIAKEIEIVITPEEESRIKEVPTTNLEAYDSYLKAREYFYTDRNEKGLTQAIEYYEKAISLDENFAHAYAGISICYYFKDIFQIQKKFQDEVNYYADKALLLGPEAEISLIAKALAYNGVGEYKLAIPYLEKALNVNPNSAVALYILSDIYATKLPNTAKYLEYAIKGLQIDIAANDSSDISITYLHISNAFIQNGFINEAIENIDKSLGYDNDNIYSHYVKAYILYAKNRSLEETEQLMLQTFEMDTNRLDVRQELAKVYYYKQDYERAYLHYKRFLEIKYALNIDIYASEYGKIGVVYSKMGDERAEEMFEKYKGFVFNDQSLYKNLSIAMYYSVTGNQSKAMEHLKLFTQEENYFYWIPVFLEIDPLVDNIKGHPEFKQLLSSIKTKFWKNHNELRNILEKKGLI